MFFGPATRWDVGMECHQGKETVVPLSGYGMEDGLQNTWETK